MRRSSSTAFALRSSSRITPNSSPESSAAGLVERGGADIVKTAVGYDGPTDFREVEAIAAGGSGDTEIKASGGIGTYEEVLEMVEAGASRIGTSSGIEIDESTQ